MPTLKLAKLPDRTPVKLSIATSPELFRDLELYASIYRAAYGVEEAPVNELIPPMLEAFLESDREFVRARKGKASDTGGHKNATPLQREPFQPTAGTQAKRE